MAPPLELLGLPVPNTPPLTIEPACRNRRSITPSNPVLCQDTGALVGIMRRREPSMRWISPRFARAWACATGVPTRTIDNGGRVLACLLERNRVPE
jgi:hypothetical protein